MPKFSFLTENLVQLDYYLYEQSLALKVKYSNLNLGRLSPQLYKCHFKSNFD